MKIIVIRPIKSIYKDDTTNFIEGLEQAGHKVVIVMMLWKEKKILANELPDTNELKDADVIWAPYEQLIPPAFMVRKLVGRKIPIVGHYEFIPPWRIDIEHCSNWGFKDERARSDIALAWEYEYKHCAKYFAECDVKTSIEPWTINNIEALYGKHIPDVKIKPYPLNDEFLLSLAKPNVEEKYQILSCFRLVGHKRADHIIRALGMLENPPKYKLVGTGNLKDGLAELANSLNVDVEFCDLITDEEKVQAIQESMFCIYPWSWLPVGEAALFKKPSIVYDHPSTRYKLKNMVTYVENNNIEELALTIKALVENNELRTNLGNKAYDELINNRSEIYPLKEAVRRLELLFEEAIKKGIK